MTRTDAHSPKNLITEDYEFVGCGNRGTAEVDPYVDPTIRFAIESGWKFGENESAGDCYHCGARLTYYAVLKHLPTQTLVRVGETCLGNRFERSTEQFQAMRKQAQLDRAAQRIKTARAAWFAINPDREVAFTFASEQIEAGNYGSDGFFFQYVHKVNRYGSTSDRYVQAMMRAMVREERWQWERAMQLAMEPEPTPVVEGKGMITGKVLSSKLQDTDFGYRRVMTVLDDRGFKVWGTVPSAITDVKRGERVTFSATVERSDRDETFGFFKRPTKAEIIERVEDATEEAAAA